MTYTYKCNSCNKEFTITKSMNDASIPVCPYCNDNINIQRVFSATNTIWHCQGNCGKVNNN